MKYKCVDGNVSIQINPRLQYAPPAAAGSEENDLLPWQTRPLWSSPDQPV